MIRLFAYLVIVLAMGFGFSWIADHPGVVTLNWQGKDIRTSLMVVIVAIVSLIALALFIWGILRGVIGFPSLITQFFTNRRRDMGYKALSQGLIAAGTGDKALARRLAKESGKLLANEPLVDLLDAQTSLLEGNREAARGRFQAMLENDETKLLGLRGLYLEAEREGAREASRQYAEEASTLAPTLAWAGNAKLRNFSVEGDWENALNTLESNRAAGLIEKDAAKRQRAVLLTARAMEQEPSNPDLAAKLAKEANRLAPLLVPAAVIGATAFVRGNNLRKASKLIESVWKKSPHPELAESYIHLRVGDSAADRLKRAQALAKMNAGHAQGNMAIGEAAVEAGEWTIAREAMNPVITNNLTERACLIMADIEEGEHGDAGRMRDWLSKAVRAPRDAKWTAGNYTSETWMPISPQTGEIDAFEWKVPVEQLQISADTIEIGDLAEPLKPVEEASDTVKAAAAVGAVAAAAAVSDGDVEETKEAPEEAKVVELVAVNSSDDKKSDDSAEAKEDDPKETVFALDKRPDDPGVEDGEGKKKFKLF